MATWIEEEFVNAEKIFNSSCSVWPVGVSANSVGVVGSSRIPACPPSPPPTPSRIHPNGQSTKKNAEQSEAHQISVRFEASNACSWVCVLSDILQGSLVL
jgi:hypothetical protein